MSMLSWIEKGVATRVKKAVADNTTVDLERVAAARSEMYREKEARGEFMLSVSILEIAALQRKETAEDAARAGLYEMLPEEARQSDWPLMELVLRLCRKEVTKAYLGYMQEAGLADAGGKTMSHAHRISNEIARYIVAASDFERGRHMVAACKLEIDRAWSVRVSRPGEGPTLVELKTFVDSLMAEVHSAQEILRVCQRDGKQAWLKATGRLERGRGKGRGKGGKKTRRGKRGGGGKSQRDTRGAKGRKAMRRRQG